MDHSARLVAEEVARLRRCLNDLASINALPALWTGAEPPQILETSLDALVGMLDAAFAFARTNDADDGSPIEVTRVGESWKATLEARLGFQRNIGTVIVASERIDFPAETDRVILDVAAHQAAMALQQFRLLRQQAFRAIEHNFQQTVDNFPGMVHTMTAAGEAEFINHRILHYFGKTRAELNDWGKLLHPDDRARIVDLWTRSVATGEPYDAEHHVLRADGTYGWLHSRGLPLRDSKGNISRWYNVLTDIDERKRAEEAVRASDARKAAILDSALDCVVTIDHEGCITEFNPAAERTFGYRRDEVMGRQMADVIIPSALRERHRQGFARYLATGEGRVLGSRIEMTALRADGTEFPAELAITRIPLDGPPSFTGYLRDITERKRAEEELQRNEAFLAEAQQLSRVGSFSWRLATDAIMCSEQWYRRRVLRSRHRSRG